MNSIIIAGNVGQDCELRHMPDGTPVASFSVASTRGSGETAKTVWFRCTMWRKYAETMAQYVTKGTAVTVFGHIDLEPRVWQDNQGNYRAGIDVTVDNIRLQGGREPGGGQREGTPQNMATIDEVPW